jgi:hypothetical protein
MELFKFGVKEDPTIRKGRLIKIRKSIEASMRFEEDALSKPLDASTLKRIYNIECLWIVKGTEIKKLGSANYSRELAVYNDLKGKYSDLKSLKLQQGSNRYHVIEKGMDIYVFSTPLELTNTDVFMILNEIEDSLEKKRIFLSSNTK